MAFSHPARHDPNTVKEQGGVGRGMDVRLNGGGVDAYLLARFDLRPGGIAEDELMQTLPSRLGQALDAVLKNRLAGVNAHLQPSKSAKGGRIFQMKRQFLIGDLTILLENGATQHLIGIQPEAAGILSPPLQQVAVNGIENLRSLIQDL